VLAAFAAIYIIWGSTYLAIRVGVATIPPFLMAGTRFLVAGGAVYAWLRWKGAPSPRWDTWKHSMVAGILLLMIGNGGVNWAEQKIPSGVAALVIAVTPLWFALLDWLRPHGTRPSIQTLIGIAVGFVGMIFLVSARESHTSDTSIDPIRFMGLIAASIGWAAGSLYSRYSPKPPSLLMGGALQMLAGGTALCVLGVSLGEADHFSIYQVSRLSLAAFFYLVVIGSLVGFPSYIWLLKASTPSRVSTYAYVNPVVAVFLGWAFAGESLTAQMLFAAAVILAGVVIITSGAALRSVRERDEVRARIAAQE
jgi:drug/metabolite transporter (DMT)-like permease